MAMGTHELEGQTLSQGRYRVTRKLGEGGMGTVYQAQDQNIESDIVIKIPRSSMMDDPEFAGRFTREIRSLVKLSHPHIVKVSDVGSWNGIPFAVMQFLPGGSLEDRRPAGPDGTLYPCDPSTVPAWLEAVAQALDYIHAQGFVHRDVKPGNILFDAEGHAFLSDFGVAKVLATETSSHAAQTAMTGAGMILGTPEYMAPELIMGEPFDGRADQYALGITVYELLCGRRPFEHETKTKLLVLHTSKTPPRLTEWCPELPDTLSQVVLKSLSKEPKDRYPSCAALAAAITTTVNDIAARESRVRLKCPACGKSGAMTAADYDRARKAKKHPACPECKSPLDVVSNGRTSGEKPPNSGGHTLKNLSQTPPKNRTPRQTVVEPSPGTPRPFPKTMIEPSPLLSEKGDHKAPLGRPQPTLIEPRPAASRPVPQTMIEAIPIQVDETDRAAAQGRVPPRTLIERAAKRRAARGKNDDRKVTDASRGFAGDRSDRHDDVPGRGVASAAIDGPGGCGRRPFPV